MTEIIPNKPRILILSLTYSPFIGGAEIAVQEIAKRLKDEFEFDLITAKMQRGLKKQEKIENVNVYRLGFGFKNLDKYFFTFFGFFKALKLHFRNRYQIAWPIMAAYASFALLFKIFFPKVKIVLTLQEGDPLEYITGLKKFKLFKPIYQLYFKKVDKVQVISNYLKDWARGLGVKEEKIEVVPNGVSLSTFTPYQPFNAPAFALERPFSASAGRPADRLQILKDDLGIKENERVILTVSRLVKKNGIEDLIKAYKLLITNYQLLITKLLIIGDGPLSNKLQNLTTELGVQDKVIFKGKVRHEELPTYYASADVFVRPSLSEGFGNVFIEAMAAGLPVITTPVGGILDFLKDGETGWFCKVKNPASIAEKIRYILEEKNREEVAQVVERARKMVEEKYDWDKVAGRMRLIFEFLIFICQK